LRVIIPCFSIGFFQAKVIIFLFLSVVIASYLLTSTLVMKVMNLNTRINIVEFNCIGYECLQYFSSHTLVCTSTMIFSCSTAYRNLFLPYTVIFVAVTPTTDCHGYLCGSGECIPFGFYCNGFLVDCTDGSDEKNCTATVITATGKLLLASSFSAQTSTLYSVFFSTNSSLRLTQTILMTYAIMTLF